MKIAPIQVDYIDHMGDDLRVANAARVSMAKESDWDLVPAGSLAQWGVATAVLKNDDAKLIRYLAKHKHWTPFAHCMFSFRIKAPIFLRAQLWKHVVGLNIAAELPMNEVSRRYVDDEPEFWFPTVWRARAPSVKQGSLPTPIAFGDVARTLAEDHCREALARYNDNITEGLAPELARCFLPQNAMTEWYWTGSLPAFARVVALRTDSHAQVEAGEVAQLMADLIRPHFPHAWPALLGEPK